MILLLPFDLDLVDWRSLLAFDHTSQSPGESPYPNSDQESNPQKGHLAVAVWISLALREKEGFMRLSLLGTPTSEETNSICPLGTQGLVDRKRMK